MLSQTQSDQSCLSLNRKHTGCDLLAWALCSFQAWANPQSAPSKGLWLQAEIEMERAQKAEAAQKEAAQAQAQHAGSDEENDDAWVMRQRAKDEWKDDHPTGWGNSKLRPTA